MGDKDSENISKQDYSAFDLKFNDVDINKSLSETKTKVNKQKDV